MQGAPIEWYDDFINTKERKVFTEHEHGIPSLRMFGYHNTTHATAALNMHISTALSLPISFRGTCASLWMATAIPCPAEICL